MTVNKEVTTLISEVLGVDAAEVKPETNLVPDLQATSLDLVEIVTMLEDMYGLSIIDDDVSKLKSVQDIVDFIEDRVRVQS
jgi:acyl carrier protein